MSQPNPAQSSATNQSRNRLLIGAIVVMLIISVAAVLALQAMFPRQAVLVQSSVQDACRVAYEEAFLKSGALTEIQFTDACEKEAQEMITTYSAAVEHCYDQAADKPNQMLECLTTEGAKFSGTYMLTART